ncbi:hypothetical protein DIPPA_06163 [Diplonema papillatum]|nr:hypothetical protein DIPPA_06163 [Diplonema papillatum]
MYIPRDWKRAIEAAEKGDYTVVRHLRGIFRNPFSADQLADKLGYDLRYTILEHVHSPPQGCEELFKLYFSEKSDAILMTATAVDGGGVRRGET